MQRIDARCIVMGEQSITTAPGVALAGPAPRSQVCLRGDRLVDAVALALEVVEGALQLRGLLQQREDIDAVLAEIEGAERDCRKRLRDDPGSPSAAEAAPAGVRRSN